MYVGEGSQGEGEEEHGSVGLADFHDSAFRCDEVYLLEEGVVFLHDNHLTPCYDFSIC